MGRIKKYKSAAEKQRAWRIRTGKQKEKVPLPIRRGEKLGTSIGQIRNKAEGESWEEYSVYLKTRLSKAAIATARDPHKPLKETEGESLKASRATGKYKEPEMAEDYYELREQYERDLEALNKRRKLGERK